MRRQNLPWAQTHWVKGSQNFHLSCHWFGCLSGVPRVGWLWELWRRPAWGGGSFTTLAGGCGLGSFDVGKAHFLQCSSLRLWLLLGSKKSEICRFWGKGRGLERVATRPSARSEKVTIFLILRQWFKLVICRSVLYGTHTLKKKFWVNLKMEISVKTLDFQFFWKIRSSGSLDSVVISVAEEWLSPLEKSHSPTTPHHPWSLSLVAVVIYCYICSTIFLMIENDISLCFFIKWEIEI